jgi:hypothetical protein
MNEETAKRRALAGRIAEIYGANPKTRAAIVVGSTARDQCDAYSDIDMTMFYETMPTEEELAASFATLGGTGLKPLGEKGEDGFAETFFLDGIDCQVGHTTLEAMDTIFSDVMDRYDAGHDPHVIVGGILESLPLLGAEIVDGWKARLGGYPDELAAAMVRHHLKFRPQWLIDERIAARDTLPLFHRMMGDAVRNILGVLLGLNRIYPEHDFKRMGALLERMTIAPAGIDARIRNVMRCQYIESTNELSGLIEDVLALVEEHMPEVDTTEVRAKIGEPAPVASV